MKRIKGYKGLTFIAILYVLGVFATVYFARFATVCYYLGINQFDFFKEAVRAGEIGIKIGGLVALINCAEIVFERWRGKR